MISYLKLINNPEDSFALLRVINTPTRGIGKSTVETLERLSLETGISLWNAVREASERRLLPGRALAALKAFQEIIEDARAMLLGSFVERVNETATSVETSGPQTLSPVQQEVEEDISFDFGMQQNMFVHGSDPHDAAEKNEIELTENGIA